MLPNACQYCRVNGVYSAARGINVSIVKGSGIGPCLCIVMKSNLNGLSRSNILIEYRDVVLKTALLVSRPLETGILWSWSVALVVLVSVSKDRSWPFRD